MRTGLGAQLVSSRSWATTGCDEPIPVRAWIKSTAKAAKAVPNSLSDLSRDGRIHQHSLRGDVKDR